MKAPEKRWKPIGKIIRRTMRSMEVNDGDALKDTAEKIQAIEGIETVNYGGEQLMLSALNSVRFGGAILVAA